MTCQNQPLDPTRHRARHVARHFATSQLATYEDSGLPELLDQQNLVHSISSWVWPKGSVSGCLLLQLICVFVLAKQKVHENMPISQLSNSGVLRLVAAISFYSDSDSLITWHLDLKALHLDGGIALAVLPPHSWKRLPLLHCCNATRWRFLLGSNLCLATHLALAPIVDSANKNFTFIANFVGRSGSWWCSLWKQNMLQSSLCTFNRWDSFGILESFPSRTLSRLVVQLQKHLQFLDFLQDSTHSGSSWDILESDIQITKKLTQKSPLTWVRCFNSSLCNLKSLFQHHKHESTANYHLFLLNASSFWSQNHWKIVNRVLQKCPSCLL